MRSAPARAAALAAAVVLSSCGGARDAAPALSSVSVDLIGQDSAGARFRICNNGFQPIRRVEFRAGGSSFSADTLLDQAHCAEVIRRAAAGLDSGSVAVTRVDR